MMTDKEFLTQYNAYDTKNGRAALSVYKSALNNRYGFCIMGNSKEITAVVAPVATQEALEKLKTSKDDLKGNFFITNETQQGNILDVKDWTPGINDAWVLGGVEGRSQFYLVRRGGFSKFSDIYIETGSQEHPVSVTARELLGLCCFQYTPVLKDGVLIFTPGKDKTVNTDLQKYRTAIYNYMTPSGAVTALKNTQSALYRWLTGSNLLTA
jgi:hypothetical protein